MSFKRSSCQELEVGEKNSKILGNSYNKRLFIPFTGPLELETGIRKIVNYGVIIMANKSYTLWREGPDVRQIQYKNYICPLH